MKADKNIQQFGDTFEVKIHRDGKCFAPPGRFTSLVAAQEARDLLLSSLGAKQSGRPVGVTKEKMRTAVLKACEEGHPILRAIAVYVPKIRFNDLCYPPPDWCETARELARLFLNELRSAQSKTT